jgi:hypothetical protein
MWRSHHGTVRQTVRWTVRCCVRCPSMGPRWMSGICPVDVKSRTQQRTVLRINCVAIFYSTWHVGVSPACWCWIPLLWNVAASVGEQTILLYFGYWDVELSGTFHGPDVTELCMPLVLSPYHLILLINGRTSTDIGKAGAWWWNEIASHRRLCNSNNIKSLCLYIDRERSALLILARQAFESKFAITRTVGRRMTPLKCASVHVTSVPRVYLTLLLYS